LNEKNENSNGFEILPVSETLRNVSSIRVRNHAQEGAVSMIRELIDPTRFEYRRVSVWQIKK